MYNTKTTTETFSVFGCGHRNQSGKAVLATQPKGRQDIAHIGQYIVSERARWATERLRAMMATASREELADFKKLNFEVATFNGTFTYRNAKSLVSRSPFVVLDIDDLASVDEARQVQQRLVADPYVETALCFVSPKGHGVKWVVRVPAWAEADEFKESFDRLCEHVAFHYGIVCDRSGSDVCRACFLPYDNKCFINPKYLRP